MDFYYSIFQYIKNPCFILFLDIMNSCCFNFINATLFRADFVIYFQVPTLGLSAERTKELVFEGIPYLLSIDNVEHHTKW